MKAREPRQKVLMAARMRFGAAWADACILNLSTRGMLVRSGLVPERGNILEIRRGRHVVIARVVWSNDQHFGVQTQDPVRAKELMQEADNSSALPAAMSVERRAQSRPVMLRHDLNRSRGRGLEYASLAIFGLASAFLLVATIDDLLGRPMLALQTALAGRPKS